MNYTYLVCLFLSLIVAINAATKTLPVVLPAKSASKTLPGKSASKTLQAKSASKTLPAKSASKTLPGKSASKTLPGKSASKTLPGKSASKTLPVKTTSKTLPVKTTKNLSPSSCKPVTVTVTIRETVTVYGNQQGNDSQCADKWAQCGGIGFNGPTCCKSGSSCQKLNDYYSQCI